MESGILRKGDELVFQPSGAAGRVEKIKVFPQEIEEVKAGDSIGIVVGCDVKRGNVGGHPDSPPTSTDKFLGEVVLLEGTLKQGDDFKVKCGPKTVKCQVRELKEGINSETGEPIVKKVEGIGQHEAATVIFNTEPLVMEKFSEIRELGRFVLVREGRNIGAGVVQEAHI